ncbi:hypothetical protein DL766_000501 [Monosporascus sp. MC13-8B]|uniref:Uncharacterized protein n=1 Tax=Monosporascus cannonballus TaxID=155416 RepID=A0ABY0GQM0_9PEZI|nr:hypothetical protein DL762_010448 [Monosporascus cannonballus]RYO76439.1 hypothetical protein DL763_010480 [Monosporascus cannonballus]RYP39243.1 hypothetical protein DL766_000501 [Monosporascus sp. MC13-8B]
MDLYQHNGMNVATFKSQSDLSRLHPCQHHHSQHHQSRNHDHDRKGRLRRSQSLDSASLQLKRHHRTLEVLQDAWAISSYHLSRHALHCTKTRQHAEIRAFVSAMQAYDQVLQDLRFAFPCTFLPPAGMQRRHQATTALHSTLPPRHHSLVIASLQSALAALAHASWRIETYASLGDASARCLEMRSRSDEGSFSAELGRWVNHVQRDAEVRCQRFERAHVGRGRISGPAGVLEREIAFLSVFLAELDGADDEMDGYGDKGGKDSKRRSRRGRGSLRKAEGKDSTKKKRKKTTGAATKMCGALRQSKGIWRTHLRLPFENSTVRAGPGNPLLLDLAYHCFKLLDALHPASTPKTARWMLDKVLAGKPGESSGRALLRHKVETMALLHSRDRMGVT